MLTVHHLARSQSERIVWLCEELALPYKLIRYERSPTGSAPPEYKALHAFGTAPVITDGNLVLAESGAIVEFLARRHAQGALLIDVDQPQFADYLHWFHFANGSLIPALMVDATMRRSGIVDGDAGSQPPGRSQRALTKIETRLGEAAFFAGDKFSAADIMMDLPRVFLNRDLEPFPNTQIYLERIAARTAWRRAMAKAEPDAVASFR